MAENDVHSSYHDSEASEDMAGERMVNNLDAAHEATLTAEPGASVGDDTDPSFEQPDPVFLAPARQTKEKKIKTLSSIFAENG
jgi:hypothetical protein